MGRGLKVSVVGLVLLGAVIGLLASSAWAQPADTATKLHFRLRDLLDRPLPPPPQNKGLVRIDEQGRVQVYIRAEPATQALLDRITALGGKIDGEALGVIQAWVPVQALELLSALPEVRYIRPPDYGHSNVGSVTTQGDTILAASAVRQQFGVDGTGVRVGVISTGIKGLGSSIALGDLPPTTFVCQNIVSLVKTQRASDCLAGEILIQTTGGVTGTPSPLGTDLASDAEGTAMLEIVHDLAPGAELWFANFTTPVDYASAASFLAANADIVVSDIALPMFFPDGQNVAAQNVTAIMGNAANRARAYIVSVGNFTMQHYSGLYTDSGINSGLVCDSLGHCSSGRYHAFAANGQIANQFTVPPAPSAGRAFLAQVFLSWNDPADASTNNYDLVLFDCATGFVYYVSNQVQNGFPQEPQEVGLFQNFLGVSFPICYAIINVGNQAAPRTFNVLITPTDARITGTHKFNTTSMSLAAPADTPGDLISVGAVNWATSSVIEPFSSLGPTFDGRNKPDVVAVDGVSVTGAGGFENPFFGTSAAAPHVAGIAALLMQRAPGLSTAQYKAILTQTAVDLGPPGVDPVFGFGRIDALSALQSIGSAASDFNRDGKSDILWRHTSGVVYTWLMNGTSIGSAASPGGVSSDWTIAGVGDFNGDGKADILWRHSSGAVGIWFMNGTAVASVAVVGSGSPDWTIVGVGDFNGDGKADILWRHSSGVVYLWLMNGTSIIGTGSPGSVSSDWTIAGVGDFDGDGRADILWRHTSGVLYTWFMNGTSIGGAASPGGVSGDWAIQGVGDFNGDGKADILWRHTSGLVYIWLMNGASMIGTGSPGGAGTDWTIKGVGDFNGDGKADILWRHTSGVVYLWLINGTGIIGTGSPGSADSTWAIQ